MKSVSFVVERTMSRCAMGDNPRMKCIPSGDSPQFLRDTAGCVLKREVV